MRNLRLHPVRSATVAVALVAVALVVLLATRPQAENVVAQSPLLGKVAPSVSGVTVTGSRTSLAGYRGRYVVLNFFASWCPACQQEEPQLVRFAADHRGTQAPAILAVVFSDSAGNALAFAANEGVTWPVVTDPAGSIALSYGVENPPDSFLISPNGRVLAEILGGVTTAGLDGLLREAAADAAIR